MGIHFFDQTGSVSLWRAISTAFVESTVNEVVSKRMVKKQQMRWTTKGAHLLLQVRTKTLNEELRDKFCDWFPGMFKAENAPNISDSSTSVSIH